MDQFQGNSEIPAGTTFCGICGNTFSGGQPGTPFCSSCTATIGSGQNNVQQQDASTPQKTDASVDTSGFKTL